MSAWRRVLALQPGHAKALRVLRDSYLAIGDYDGLTELYAAERATGRASSRCSRARPTRRPTPSSRSTSASAAPAIYAERAQRAGARVPRLRARPLACGRTTRAPPPRSCRSTRRTRSGGACRRSTRSCSATPSDTDEKLALLDKLVQVTGQQLQDRAAAFGWARKAYELAPARDGALDAFEAAARAAEQWPGFVDALGARLEVLEGSGRRQEEQEEEGRRGRRDGRRDELRVLRAKLAEVYAREMGRVDEAVADVPRARRGRRDRRASPCRRSTASCARPIAATTCAGSSTCASSARTPR